MRLYLWLHFGHRTVGVALGDALDKVRVLLKEGDDELCKVVDEFLIVILASTVGGGNVHILGDHVVQLLYDSQIE